MPTAVGNILQDTLQNILANAASRAIRASIRDGTYQYCDESRCGIMANGLLNNRDTLPSDVSALIDDPERFIMPREIVLSGDIVCNLSCPSCRTKVIKKNHHSFKQATEVAQIMVNNIFSMPTEQHMRLMVSTTGELFASTVLMKLVSSLRAKDFPNLKLKIQTNGVLAPSRWHRLGDMADQVESVTVTVDAAQPDTYELLRRGAKWHQIQTAMSWLKQKKTENGMLLHTRMIVQAENYQQMQLFYNWSRAHGADTIELARIMDWQTFDDAFWNHDVFDPRHPESQQAQLELQKVAKLPGVLLFGGLHALD
jgi:wyosine [tRNA(Phe)-imidazoG37] synthetase (radical SAM superfamily)